LQPNNNSNNNGSGTNVPGASGPAVTNPQSREFQIPRGGSSGNSPAAPSVPKPAPQPQAFPAQAPPQPTSVSPSMQSASVSGSNNNRPLQPPRHDRPIYMNDPSGSASSLNQPRAQASPGMPQPPSGLPSVPQPPSRPISGQPLQKPIPAPVGAPSSTPKKRKSSSMLRYVIFAVIAAAVVFGLVWVFISVFSGDADEQAANNGEKELSTNAYQSDSMKFTTKFPSDWLQDESSDDDFETVKFSSPDVRSNGTAVAETAVLRIPDESLEDNKNEETFYKTYEDAVKSAFESYTETDSEIVTVDDYSTKRIEANVNTDGESDKAVFYFVFAEDSGYVIISYADQEVYDEYKPKLDVFISEFDSQLNN